MSCEVRLLSCTQDALFVVAAAAKLCYSPAGACELMEGLDREKASSFLAHLCASGHMSPFEHASFTFAIDGISRAASHQLVRHRIASYSQQSQRYVKADNPDCVIPETVQNNDDARRLMSEHAATSLEVYKKLMDMGIPAEDARFALPGGWSTRLVVTMNARELYHFFSVRLCRRAQWEIRALARMMLMSVTDAVPELFTMCGPKCITGGCTEARPCGKRYYSIKELIEED